MQEKLDKTYISAWAKTLTSTQRTLAEIDRELKEKNLISLTWYDVLYAVYASPEKRLKFTDIANTVILSKSALSRSVDNIAKAGLLKKIPCDQDGRACWLELTAEGESALRACWEVYEAGIRKYFLGDMSIAEANQLVELFKRCSPK